MAKSVSGLKDLAEKVENAVTAWRDSARYLATAAAGPEVKSAFAHAYPLMEVTGDVVMAWMLLWRAVLAAGKMETVPKKKGISFYEGQLKSAEYFIRTVLPVTAGRISAILDTCPAAMDMPEEAFG